MEKQKRRNWKFECTIIYEDLKLKDSNLKLLMGLKM